MMPDRPSGSNNCGQIEAAPEEADTVRPVKDRLMVHDARLGGRR
jgi:hypothetical protein